MATNAERKRKRRDQKFLTYVVIFFAAVCVAAVIRQVWRWYDLRLETVATQERISQLEKQREQLLEEQKRLGTKEYVEKVARDEYNMVGKDEVPIFIVDDKK